MALIPVYKTRTSKPPLGTPLRSDGHWSVQGLVGCWAFNEGAGKAPVNAVDNTYPTDKSSGFLLDATGYCTPTHTDYLVYDVKHLSLGEFTFLTVARNIANRAGATWSDLVCLRSSNAYEELVLETQVASDKLRPAVYNINGLSGATEIASVPYVFDDHTESTVVWTASTGQNKHILYAAGLLIGESLWGVTADTHKCASITLGNRQSALSSRGVDSAKYVVDLLYNSALSPSQVASLSANPWQIYEPELVWIEIPDGAGTNYTSSANPGTVALTGSATTNYHIHVSSSDAGAVTLTGLTASDYRGLVSLSDAGAITLSGVATSDYRGLVSPADIGTVTLVGSTASDYYNRVSSAATGSVTLTGYAATDTVTAAGSYTSIAATGTITLTGSPATDYRTLISGAATGTVTLTGFAATDTITEPGAYTSEAAAGTINLAGSPATTHRSSVAASSAIQLVGSEATGYFGFTSGAEPSAVIITGAQTAALRTWISGTTPGSIIITGYDASGVSPIYEISKIFASARLSGPTATGRITTPTTGISIT